MFGLELASMAFMMGALHSAATGMSVQEQQIEAIANNIANTQTIGYKKSRAEFQDLLYETIQEPGVATSQTSIAPGGIQRGSGAKLVATQKIMSGGTPKNTKRALDVMINGAGFLMIQLPSGQIGFTRNGALKKDSTGMINNEMGYPMVPNINIPPNSMAITISETGIISSIDVTNQIQQIGQFQLATFVNPEGLKAIGGGLYMATTASGPESVVNPGTQGAGGLVQYHLEASNVNAVEEMVNMISAQRAYELNSKVIQSVDQMMQSVTGLK